MSWWMILLLIGFAVCAIGFVVAIVTSTDHPEPPRHRTSNAEWRYHDYRRK
jgi:hypothetical protein